MLAQTASLQHPDCFCAFISPASTYCSLRHSTYSKFCLLCPTDWTKKFELLVYLDFVFAKTSTPKDRDGKNALKP